MPEFVYGSGKPQPVPPMKPEQIAEGVTLIRPLSRKGVGPGLILLVPEQQSETPIEIENGIPSLRMKWAEEGYCVVEIRPQAGSSALKTAVAKLNECQECEPKEKMGVVCMLPVPRKMTMFD
jgi:carboxymethylenebutenolidase